MKIIGKEVNKVIKLKKRISILTLTIFMLTLIFTGIAPAFAKTAPGSPPPAQAPGTSSSGDNDRPSGVSPEGDVVKKSIGQGPVVNAKYSPYLDEMWVFDHQNNILLHTDAPIANPYIYYVDVPSSFDSVRLKLDPQIMLPSSSNDKERVDKITITAGVSSQWKRTYQVRNDTGIIIDTSNIFQGSGSPGPIPLNPAGPITTNTTIIVTMTNLDTYGEDGPDDQSTSYTIIVRRAPLIPVTGVSLELDGQGLADGADLFMSQKSHTLQAVLAPEGANFPNPMVFEWLVDDENNSVEWEKNGDELDIDPKPNNPGTVEVTLNIKDGKGAIFASASCTIHVGKIDVFVKGKPELKQNGEYEAVFGYSSTFDVPVTIPIGYGNYYTEPLVYAPGTESSQRPAIFAPTDGDIVDAFTVRYLTKKTWSVCFEGYYSHATARTYKTIELDKQIVFAELSDPFTLTATADTFGYYESDVEQGRIRQCEVVWEVVYGKDVVRLPHHSTNSLSVEVTPKKPGKALIKVSVDDGHGRCGEAYSCITVLDDRTLRIVDGTGNSLDTMSLRKGSTGLAFAEISEADFDFAVRSNPERFDWTADWKKVKWGFVDENSWGWDFVNDVSSILDLSITSSDSNPFNKIDDIATFTAKAKGREKVVAYLDNNLFSWPHWLEIFDEIGLNEQEFNCMGCKQYLACIPKDRYDILEVTVTSKTRRTIEEEEKSVPKPPAPPALETLDVTLTVDSDQAIVNGAQVTLAGPTLLINEDRAMVDYADIAKIIPGTEVAWDWKTQSVTFTKGEQSLTMKLNEIPSDFDVPFINLGGRLVVPVRYVGNLIGATVDWNGITLVVHMYK